MALETARKERSEALAECEAKQVKIAEEMERAAGFERLRDEAAQRAEESQRRAEEAQGVAEQQRKEAERGRALARAARDDAMLNREALRMLAARNRLFFICSLVLLSLFSRLQLLSFYLSIYLTNSDSKILDP